MSHIIKSITLDNGKEFTNHEQLLPKSERKVYFCNPYSPWQKPLIEKNDAPRSRATRYLKKF
uniref:hypothetical protein n=1 Tax=Rickettsia endosymbiont of Urophora cardui TaxID=3066265 RepID=UPI00313F2CF5